MGLEDATTWKTTLYDHFGVEWISRESSGARARSADVVAVDLMVVFNTLCRSPMITEWNKLRARTYGVFEAIFVRHPKARRFVIALDEQGKTPLPKLRHSDEPEKAWEKQPLTDDELARLGSAAFLCSLSCRTDAPYRFLVEELRKRKEESGPGRKRKQPDGAGNSSSSNNDKTGFQIFMGKYLRTKRLRGDMSRFIMLSAIDWANQKRRSGMLRGREIVIDGGICVAPTANADWRKDTSYPQLYSNAHAKGLSRFLDPTTDGTEYLGLSDDDEEEDDGRNTPSTTFPTQSQRNPHAGGRGGGAASTSPPSKETEELMRVSTSSDYRRVTVSGDRDTPLDEPSWTDPATADGRSTARFMSVAHKHNGIGEADIKLLREADIGRGKHVWIVVDDTDLIPILLLVVRSLIDPATGKVPPDTSLVLDMDTNVMMGGGGSTPASGYRSVIDVVDLWRRVLRRFRADFPRVEAPIETVAFLMILPGTDYFRRFARLGVTTVWDAFAEHGGHVFFHGKPIDVGSCVGTPAIERPRQLRVDEGRLADFVRFCYACSMGKEKVRSYISVNAATLAPILSKDTGRHVDPRTAQRMIADFTRATCPAYPLIDAWRKKFKAKKPPGDFTPEWTRACIRRATWNLLYWLNGHTHMCPDPVLACPRSSGSVYGWKRARRESAVATPDSMEEEGEDHESMEPTEFTAETDAVVMAIMPV